MLKQWPLWQTPPFLLPVRTLVVLVMPLILVALVLVTLAWQYYSFWETSRLQQRLLEQLATAVLKDNPVVTASAPKSIPKKIVKRIPETLLEISESKLKTLSLVQVNLPPLPSMPSPPSKPSRIPKATPNNANYSESHQNISKSERHKIVNTKNLNTSIKQIKQSTSIKQQPSVKATSTMYQQLISDRSIDIEIAWPNNAKERQNTFSFLYQCIGMKFGVLNKQANGTNKVTLAKNTYHLNSKHLNNKHLNNNHFNATHTSDWLRIAQGELAMQEIQWLKQYSLSGTPVRLFPKSIDWQLASLLTKKLNNTPLIHFRARYKYQNNQLVLSNIVLNKLVVTNNWTLAKSDCLI